VEVAGLRFTIEPKIKRAGGGITVDVAVRVTSIDAKPHVIYGLSKGIAFGGIRFGKQGGGMPLSEGGKVQRYGRVRPGTPLTIGRSFPGPGAAQGAWSPLQPGDSLILSLRSWHTLGAEPSGQPVELDIGAVTVRVSDGGEPDVKVEQPKR
jgi:hypothetical protein